MRPGPRDRMRCAAARGSHQRSRTRPAAHLRGAIGRHRSVQACWKDNAADGENAALPALPALLQLKLLALA